MATKDDKPPIDASRPSQRSERGVTGPESGFQPQEQPEPQSAVMAHEATPDMGAEERKERGTDPEDREAKAKEQKRRKGTHTVLRQLIHQGKVHHPGGSLTLTEDEAAPLIESDAITPGDPDDDEVKPHLKRHHVARRRAMAESGIPVPPETTDAWETTGTTPPATPPTT